MNKLELPVSELAKLIKNKEVTSVELTKLYLQQAHDKNETINAYISFRDELALKRAEEMDKEIANGHYRGMYHGIPMAIKDNIYLKDEVTTMASKIHADFVSDYDATVVKKMDEAGIVQIGKLNMHEYAWGISNNSPHFGPVKNPWNLNKIPGGSSGGSGAAVAANMTAATLGTDTAGSIRIPSSACGIVGLKPSHGRVSKYGVYPLAWSLDHVGPMTKTVEDAAGLLEVISGFDPNDPTSANLAVEPFVERLNPDMKGIKIGINESFYFNEVDQEVETVIRQAIERFKSLGAEVLEVEIDALKYSEYTELVTSLSEASAIHHEDLLTRADDFGDDIRLLFEVGELFSSVDYLQAQQLRRQIKQDFNKVFKEVDILLAPTLPVIAPDIGNDNAKLNGKDADVIDQFIRFMGPGNLAGLPAMSVPAGLSSEGMPIGLQIIANAFEEQKVLNAGLAFEQTNPLKGAKPKVH